MRHRKPTFVSLFSGCGGFDVGFQAAGYQGLGAYDCDEVPVNAYRRNLPFPAFVADLSLASFRRLPKCDVVLAGPPCQGFSTLGKRILEDPRNDLLLRAARLAVTIRPRVVVLENVAGVIAGNHSAYWAKTKNILKNAGYNTEQLICRTDAHGLPQIRKRVILIGWKGKRNDQIVLPQSDACSIRSVLYSIPSNLHNHSPVYLDSRSIDAVIANRIGPNQKLSNVRNSDRSVHTWDIPEVFGKTSKKEKEVLNALILRRRQRRIRKNGDGDPVSASDLARFMNMPVASVLNKLLEKDYLRKVDGKFDFKHTFNGKYRRLQWDLPAPTVDTKFGDPRYFLHPEENRAFTVREAARVQGFPDDFVFEGTLAQQYRMIANAVPPSLSQIIATELLSLL